MSQKSLVSDSSGVDVSWTYKSSFFWILLVVLSLTGAFTSYYFFGNAFPIINLNLTMNRQEAIEKAALIAKQFNLGPEAPHIGASFSTDHLVKTFVELKAGGKETLTQMIETQLYQPFTWQVRHFKEYEKNESFIFFTPDGHPYGFTYEISERTEGAQLTEAEALTLAKSIITADPWHISLDHYALVESSFEKKISGRVDHYFTFERTDTVLGKDGYYRLLVTVGGDQVTQIKPTVKVPDTFDRYYLEMRSANENFSQLARLLILVLYVLGGCVGGLLYLYGINWILWKTPLYVAVIMATLLSLNNANQIPLAWMHYNTQISYIVFLSQQAIGIVGTFIMWTIILFFTFCTAESLTRKAFSNQIQLWSLRYPSCISSWKVLAKTMGGYFLVPILLAYSTLLYFWATSNWGWWYPSSALFDPNVLATYFPWYQSITLSLNAGFWEECLFRAIPLAGAALLGTYFKRRNLFIAIAFVVQAFIFGAAHANYPAQPSYARIVELLFTSSFFGYVYLQFGLITGIITHYVYDVFWFALPIFVSSAQGSLLNKALVLFFASMPLLYVVACRLKIGTWKTNISNYLNSAWHPQQLKPQPKIIQKTEFIALSKLKSAVLGLTTILAGVIWLLTTHFSHDGVIFTIDAPNAEQQAKSTLTMHNIDTDAWFAVTHPFKKFDGDSENQLQHRFIWQQGGKQLYHQLRGTYLIPPLWITRFTKWDGSLSDRAEEYEFFTHADGKPYRFFHALPEDREGATLAQQEARAIALKAIRNKYNKDNDELIEISALSTKHPSRVDWEFNFKVPNDLQLNQGQARIKVVIGGDLVLENSQYIHVPEQWQRKEQNKLFIEQIIKQLCRIALYVLLVLSILFSLAGWHSTLRIPKLLIVASFLILIFAGSLFNTWPTIIAHFNTSQPFQDQLFRFFSHASLMVLIQGGLLALIITYLLGLFRKFEYTRLSTSIFVGTSIGTIFTSLISFTGYLMGQMQPLWPVYAPLGSLVPFLAHISNYVVHYVAITTIALIATHSLNILTQYGTKNKPYLALTILSWSMILSGLMLPFELSSFVLLSTLLSLGLATGYWYFIRYGLETLPWVVYSYVTLALVPEVMFNAFAYSWIGGICTIGLMGALSYTWTKQM